MSEDSTMLTVFANLPEARKVEAGANQPFQVDNQENLWFVVEGSADLFLVRVKDDKIVGARRPLLQLDPRTLFVGLPRVAEADGLESRLLCVPGVGSRLISVPAASARQALHDAYVQDAANALDRWIAVLAQSLLVAPEVAFHAKAGDKATLQKGMAIAPQKGVLWAQIGQGAMAFVGHEDHGFAASDDLFIPVSDATALVATADDVHTRATFLSTADVLGRHAGWKGLLTFQATVMRAAMEARAKAEAEEAERLVRRAKRDEAVVGEALDDLLTPLKFGHAQALHSRYSDNLLEACRIVGESIGLEIRRPRRSSQGIAADALWHISRASHCQTREVNLTGPWYRHDNGPLLGFLKDERAPVALLPVGPRHYAMIDPRTHVRIPVTAKIAGTLDISAYQLYRNLPERDLHPLDLLKFGLGTTSKDAATILTVGILSGLVALITPIGTGLLINTIIPASQKSELYDLAIAMLACAFGSAAYSVTRAIATLRMEGRMEGEVQAALFTRLLMLRAPFFRRFSTGDLASRLLGINSIRQMLTAGTTTSILSGIFSIFSYLLLFYYSWKMAVVASFLVLIYVFVYCGAMLFQLRQQRAILDLEGSIQGHVLQLLLGISKLRVAAAESRAYREWAWRFARQRRLKFESRLINVHAKSFQAMFKVFTSLVLFGFLAWSDYKLVNAGDFMAFITAFGQFFSAVVSMAGAVTSSQSIGPLLARAEPILQASLEVDASRPDPGRLTGALEMRNINFRYEVDGPLTLENVSFEAHPGEMVAIVGPSGSGKSTLLRMLLGFEKPESGEILYDGQTLSQIDVQAVRRQIGVVLQDGRLMPGDIYYNIVGSTLLSVDDAWEAARVASIAADIKAMPMGMHTVVMEGAGTFSGGQRQRLMIARAVVSRPRYLFLDEATSALDATIQEQVSQALEGIQATRVVIAHRLSTIRHADRIYVLHNGKMEQTGTYDELVNQPGLFRELVTRQLA
jgi:NHLM bacteriocin system ABC transporter ATP-binding protein